VIRIAFDDDQRPEEGLIKVFERAAELAAEREGMSSGEYEVSLFFADADEMRSLNARYRGLDEPTDVLSFPMLEDISEASSREGPLRGTVPVIGEEAGDSIKGTVPVIARSGQRAAPQLLGDIVICREIAEAQAKEYGHSEERELVFLFTHGLLHLLGKGHEGEGADAEAMQAAEKEILAGLGLGG